MTRYLHHLAARARGRLEVIRPRVPSRFEPWAGAPLPGDAWTAEPAAESQAPAGDPPLESRAPAQAAHTNGPPAPFVAARPERAEAHARVSAFEPEAARAAAPSALEPAAFAPEQRAVPGDAVMAALEQAALGQAALVQAPSASSSLPLRRQQGSGPAAIGVPDRAVLRAAAAVQPGGAEDTVVHVTIGRIDVRAVAAPAAPAPRPRAAPQARLLEDWLGGRSR